MQHEVFISFSFKNRKQAEELAACLKAQYGISCWICTQAVTGGVHYKALIPEAIDVAKVVLLILSSDAILSKEIPKEVGIALEAEKIIIPFKIDEVKLKGELRYDLQGIDWIDGTVPEYEDRVADLAQSIYMALGRKTTCAACDEMPMLRSSTIVYSDIFYGREALIESIHRSYQAGAKTVFLKGMGGIGKTELAKQYIKKYRSEYETVVFARYDSDLRALIVNDELFLLRGVARKIKADGSMQTDEEYAREKLSMISRLSSSRMLIVIDNYDVMFDPYLDKLCSTGAYRLLFTTRYDQDTKKYSVLPVNELSDEDLKAFMIDCCEREYLQLEPDDPGFEPLFAMTGRHTLTLELLAKYMCENSIDTVAELVDLLHENGLALPGTTQVVYGSNYSTVDQIIHDLFRMSALSDEENRFMHYLALMPPSGIQQPLFKKWCGSIYAQARTRLIKLSLVKFDAREKKLFLHPIIRQSLLGNFTLSFRDCKPFVDAIVQDVDENTAWNYPVAQKEILTRCCLSLLEQFPDVNDENDQAWYEIAVFLNFTDEYESCHRRFEALRDFAVEHYGEDSIQHGRVLFRLGWLAANRMKPRIAQRYQQRALEILERHKRTAASDYIHCLCDYANSMYVEYLESGQEATLEQSFHFTQMAYEMAQIAVQEALSPDAFLRKGLAANTLVKHYILREQYRLAAEKIEEAIEAFEKQENGFLDMASILAKQGMLYVRMGNPGAKESLNRSISLYEQYGGKYSGTYFECLWTMIEYMESQGDFAEAIRYSEKTLDYARLVYEEGHQKIIRIKDKISTLREKITVGV